MLDTLAAIQQHFNDSAVLTATFPDGCYLSKAPNTEALPVCVLTVISNVADYNTGSDWIERMNVQFSVFATSDIQAAGAAEDIARQFDFARLPINVEEWDEYTPPPEAGLGDYPESPHLIGQGTTSHIECRRVAGVGIVKTDDDVWNAFVEYRVVVQRMRV